MNRGSEWRIWDLHVHTPLSIENNYGCTNDEEGWNKYITALEQLPSDIKVLGINPKIRKQSQWQSQLQ